MDSTPDTDPTDELVTLAAQLRAQLARHVAGGAWAAPGGLSRREEAPASPQPALAVTMDPAPLDSSQGALDQLRAELGECMRCKLCSTRRSIVWGVGDAQAPLVFVGEAPGEQEDRRGEPFVGPAGELLDKMIDAMGWTRASVFITNVLMCRPPNNRNPQPDEIEQCLPFLNGKLQKIAPRIIVALGRPSANTLLGTDAPISTLRGRFHDRHGVQVMPTFHPSYLLREPDRKRDTWSDLKLVIAELERLGIKPPNASRG